MLTHNLWTNKSYLPLFISVTALSEQQKNKLGKRQALWLGQGLWDNLTKSSLILFQCEYTQTQNNEFNGEQQH